MAIRGQSVIFLTWVRVGCKDSEKVWCQVWKSPEVAFWRHSKWCHHGKIMNSHVYHISRTTRHRDLADPSKCSQDTSFYSCFIQCMTLWSLEMAKISYLLVKIWPKMPVTHISKTNCHRDLVDPSKCSQDTSFYSCFIQCMTFWSLEMAKISKFHNFTNCLVKTALWKIIVFFNFPILIYL